MKFLAAILLLVLAASPALTFQGSNTFLERVLFKNEKKVRDALGDKLKNFLEEIKDILRTGNSTLGIPKLDPFELAHETVSIDHDSAKLNIDTSDVHIAGISNYSVDSASFALIGLKITIGLSWPTLYLTSGYDVTGSVLSIPIYGRGDVTTTAENFSLLINTGLAVKQGKLTISSLSSQINLDNLQFFATGLYNNDDLSLLVSNVITDMTPELLTDFHNDITAIANGIATKYVNEILSDLSLSDLISLLG